MIKNIKILLAKLMPQKLAAIYHMMSNPDMNLEFNKNVLQQSTKGDHTKLYPPYKIFNADIGNYTYIAENSKIYNVSIGKFCSIGPNIFAGWGIHPLHGISTSPMFYSTLKQNGMTLSSVDKVEENRPIKIGNDVFIGMNVTILDGITIGDGAVIGAGSVVSKDIPPYAIAVGSPIKVVRYRFDEATIQRLLEIKWWDSDEKLQEVEENFFNVEAWIQNQSKP